MSKKSPARKPVSTPEKSLHAFEGIENYFAGNHLKAGLIIPLVLGILFALLTFDIKISEGNDDAMYIEAATKYAADFTGYYYTANAPLYPMLLGILTMVTGFNLAIYKLLSTLFFLVHLALMYFAFRNRVPWTVLIPVMILSSVNSFYLYYASQTYTEMLFVSLQALFFWVFFSWYYRLNPLSSANRAIDDPSGGKPVMMEYLKAGLAIGTALFFLTYCKNIAIGMLGALIAFLAFFRQWKFMGLVTAGYVVIRFSFMALKTAVWGPGNQYGSQGAILLQKDAYNPAAGQEDLQGFIKRFFENFNLYTSKRIFQVLGFKDPDSNQVHTILSLLVVGLLIFAAIRIFSELKRNQPGRKSGPAATPAGNVTAMAYAKNMLLVFIYICTMHFLTYLVLQTRWDQPRLIMVYVPLLVMVVLYAFYSYFKNQGIAGRVGYIFIAVLLTGSCLLTTVKKSVAHYPVLKKNLKGDKYFGYTPDWENFLRLSEWSADSLPPNSFVASRKAPMSFVYGKGKPFFPVYTVPFVNPATNQSDPDSVLALFRENKVTHVLVGSLRRNSIRPDGYVVNTMHRMLQPVAQKYPDKVRLVKQIGESEPAYLYEIIQ